MARRILTNLGLLTVLLLINSASGWASSPPIQPPGASLPQSYNPGTGSDLYTISNHGGSFDTTPVDHTGTENDIHYEYNHVQSKEYQGKQPIHKGF
ncbi:MULTISPECIES: hypothetical protein [Legionella]|uniref:Uncharacterized protein n=1 Tax=Legionella donaldsonii TaxID=45060 RepID=A0A378J2Z3_9GAMM|nr:MULTISPECIES: hypothetical protein [Legionella]MCC5015256.1 hypothetical protein [Legionella sp. 31fI33]STX42134.1 Uncharacterised protein [Legionella donaldsonii]